MERDLEELRELAAAYVLNALDGETEAEFEEELRRSPALREEVAELREAASALAYALPAPPPPPALRERILEAAVAERPGAVVLPFRRRALVPGLGALAAAAAAAAIGLGIWGSSLADELDEREAALAARDRVAALVATPGSRTIAFDQVDGTLVVGTGGTAALVVNGLGETPSGRRYQAWVIPPGESPIPAGMFDGATTVSILLTRDVPAGSIVAVTIEDEAGVAAPTSEPLFGTTLT